MMRKNEEYALSTRVRAANDATMARLVIIMMALALALTTTEAAEADTGAMVAALQSGRETMETLPPLEVQRKGGLRILDTPPPSPRTSLPDLGAPLTRLPLAAAADDDDGDAAAAAAAADAAAGEMEALHEELFSSLLLSSPPFSYLLLSSSLFLSPLPLPSPSLFSSHPPSSPLISTPSWRS